RTHVQVRVEGSVAHVEVEEWFRNRGPAVAEGIYHYPLPGETAFQGYSLFQGDVELTGELMDADSARAIYEEIVRRRKDPALIELVDQGLVRARVFPFQPGESRRIILRYTQLLDRGADAFELRWTAGARDGAPLTFTVTADEGDRFLDPFSPTHGLEVSRAEGELRVRPDGELAGRFVLFLPLAGEPVRLALATHRPTISEDGYFMLTLSPGQVAASAAPRDVTMVVDVSGSMSGEKMEQTRRALLQLLGSMGPEDRFRLIRFSNGVEAHRAGWSRAVDDELADARAWVRSLEAHGGTNIAGALEEAFRERTSDGRLPVVVFLTDGLPTVGERNPEHIADRTDDLTGRARVFAFGVGYDVDTHLLERLTVAGRGSLQYVGPGEDVEHALGALAMKIRHPVLTELELAEMPVRIREVYPRELPDLFAGGELTLVGRYAESGEGTLAVTGRREGREARFRADVRFSEHEPGGDYIPRLWASRKIGELTREVRLHGADPELVDEIRRTALRYGILTEYTSYLVLEPDAVAGGRLVPPPMPDDAEPSHGRDAVLQSMAAGRAREASSAGDLKAAEEAAMDALGPAAPGGFGAEDLRLVAGRAFVLRDGVWTDRLHDPEGRVAQVAPYSRAWFDLLAALPELGSWWTELSPVIVAGERVSLAVTEDGTSSLSAEELDELVHAFRAPDRGGR
ncbi:MAG: VIT domain-containing protein, partial [bacterium]